MATALYRRYRPETFSEMIGQAQVTDPLMTALRTERIGHAYLFSGPRGCGKTTSARILARCLNCAEGPTDAPCGTCPSCIELSREGGGSLDVVEIDAASHGGVDDARELRERAVFAPARDRFKIFIIDEAHMVTPGGFNALLKIVEEPPPHVKFIFATTEPDKVIGTIRSRTHHYPFRLIAPGTLIDYVQHLAVSEGIEAEPGVLPLVVRAGGGSVRDTLSILDQLIAGSESSTLTLERATGLLGYTSTEMLDAVVVAFSEADSAAAFSATDRVVQTGQDPRRFVEDLLERLRDLIVISATTVQGASAVFRGVPDDQLQRMFEQSQSFPRGLLSRIADTVGEALDRMTGATAPRLHLELMVARALVVVQGFVGGGVAKQSAQPTPATTQHLLQVPPQAARPSSVPSEVPSVAPASAASAVRPIVSAPDQAAAVDVIAAMRSARDFLQKGSESPTEAVTTPEAASGPEPTSTPDTPGTSEEAPSVEHPSVEPVSFADLDEMWPELLQELLESDRESWNAVKNVQPLALERDVLTVGIASRSDLELFKAAGAGPLREAIEAALGITVKYVPKAAPAAAQSNDSSAREPESAPEEPSPTVERAPSPPPSADLPSEPAQQLAVADREPEFSEPPAPAWSEPLAEQGEEEEAAPEVEADPELESEPPPEAAPEPEPEPEYRTALEPANEPANQPVTAAAPPQMPEPIVGRYGEAVVREVLSARFIEERPLPQNEE